MNNTRKVTLSFNNGQYCLTLAVTPKNITVTKPQVTKKYMTLLGQEINLSSGMGLSKVKINTFLPKIGTYSISGTDQTEPKEIIRLLKFWQETRKPIRLVISETDINEAFLIEDFSQIFHEGDSDTEISISLAQYRFVTALYVNDRPESQLNEREPPVSQGQSYVMKKGDTLWWVSKKFYGTPYRWGELKERNGIIDERKIPIGTVIWL